MHVRKRSSDGMRCLPIDTDRTSSYLGQSVSIDMGPRIGNGGGPDAAGDMDVVPHCPNVYITDVPRDDSVAPERRNAIPNLMFVHAVFCHKFLPPRRSG